jgi:hypothetical protein
MVNQFAITENCMERTVAKNISCNNFWPLTSLCDLAASQSRRGKHNHNLYHQSVSFQVHWFRLFQADW